MKIRNCLVPIILSMFLSDHIKNSTIKISNNENQQKTIWIILIDKCCVFCNSILFEYSSIKNPPLMIGWRMDYCPWCRLWFTGSALVAPHLLQGCCIGIVWQSWVRGQNGRRMSRWGPLCRHWSLSSASRWTGAGRWWFSTVCRWTGDSGRLPWCRWSQDTACRGFRRIPCKWCCHRTLMRAV